MLFPACWGLFIIIPKEKMPDIRPKELLIAIDWNENIHFRENQERCLQFSSWLSKHSEEHAVLVGQQQFLLNKDREQTATEAEFYIRTKTSDDIAVLKSEASAYLSDLYPIAKVVYSPTGALFEKIFSTGEPDLVVEYYAKNKLAEINADTVIALENSIKEITGEKPETPSFQQQLNLYIDREKLTLYNIPYEQIYRILKTAFKENRFATLRSQQQYLPVVLGNEEKTVYDILTNTLVETSLNVDGSRNTLPLSTFVATAISEDMKTIVSGKSGEFIPFYYYETDKAEKIVDAVQNEYKKNAGWEVDFSGTFFSNKKMLRELIVILFVSLLLMFFILSAQFENFKQPLIVLFEIPVDIAAALALLLITGNTMNLMSAIGIVVTAGIVINDSILKVDAMNQLRKAGFSVMEAIHEAGRRRLKAILMTSMTSIVCMIPLLFTNDLGSQLEKPLAIAIIGGMLIGTPVSLFVVPLIYWGIYGKSYKL